MNYLTQASVFIKADADAAARIITDHQLALAGRVADSRIDTIGADPSSSGEVMEMAEAMILQQQDGGVWITSVPGCDFDNNYAGALISNHLRAEASDDIVTWSYANTASRPTTDAYGGGVVVVSASGWDIRDCSEIEKTLAGEWRSRQRAERLLDGLVEQTDFADHEALREALDLDDQLADLFDAKRSDLANLHVVDVVSHLLEEGVTENEIASALDRGDLEPG